MMTRTPRKSPRKTRPIVKDSDRPISKIQQMDGKNISVFWKTRNSIYFFNLPVNTTTHCKVLTASNYICTS